MENKKTEMLRSGMAGSEEIISWFDLTKVYHPALFFNTLKISDRFPRKLDFLCIFKKTTKKACIQTLFFMVVDEILLKPL